MARNPPPVHLTARRGGPVLKGACGIEKPKRWTRHPAEVTCKLCAKTVRMAVAEQEFYTTRGKGTW